MDDSCRSKTHKQTDHYLEDRSAYTTEQIGNIPHWVSEQNKAHQTQERLEATIYVSKMNSNQRMAFNNITDLHINNDNNQLLMMITGLGGSGKSYIIKAVRNLLDQQCKVCAYFGIAAFNIKGNTSHSPLKASALANLQNDLNGEIDSIIDEYSVIGQKLFA